MTTMRWNALHDHDFEATGLRDVIEGTVEAETEEEAIDKVRKTEGFDERVWDVWIEQS